MFRVAGILASAIGGLVIVTALLYVVLAVGILAAKRRAPIGFFVIGLNVLLALSGTIKGESMGEAVAWMIVPAILLWYLLSARKNQPLKVSP